MKNILILLATCFAFSPARAQDVYNFYFQKAPGVSTVIQSGNAPQPVNPEDKIKEEQSSSPTKHLIPPPQQTLSTKSEVASNSPAPRERNWRIGLGMAQVNDALSTWSGTSIEEGKAWNSDRQFSAQQRYALSIQYILNRYLAFDFDSAIGSRKGDWQGETGRKLTDSFTPSLALSVIPLHLNFFGYETLRIGAQFGTMSMISRVRFRPVREYDETGWLVKNQTVVDGFDSTFVGFVGLTVGFNILDHLSLNLSIKSLPNAPQHFNQTTTTLAYRF